MATAALEFALDRGLRIFPVGRSKVRVIRGWPQRATNDLRQIEDWGKKFPGCNCAALTGAESGLLVVDVDGSEGRSSLAEMERKYGPLPPTSSVRTGRAEGGEQLHWRWPAGRELHGSVGKIAKGIDIRAHHGVAVIPDSIHPKTEQRYEWETLLDRAPMPQWLVDLIEQNWLRTHTPRQRTEQARSDRPDVDAATPCGHADRRLYGFRALLPGKRYNGLLRVAGKLRRKGASFDQMLAVLRRENVERCRPPKSDEQVVAIAREVCERYVPFDSPDLLETAWSRLSFCDAASTAFKF